MNISIRMGDFAPDRLVCLAGKLRLRYAGRKRVLIPIFSTNLAAKRYDKPLWGDTIKPRVDWAAQMHGIYSLDAEKREEYVEIMPLGPSGPFETKISLPVTAIPSCTLELAGRCLLALDRIEYPWEALKAKASGTVTLEGTIARGGEVKNVRVMRAEVAPENQKDLLRSSALQNLKTWRFEAASRRNSIRIAYSYVIEPPHGLGQTSVQFHLPNMVEIRGRVTE